MQNERGNCSAGGHNTYISLEPFLLIGRAHIVGRRALASQQHSPDDPPTIEPHATSWEFKEWQRNDHLDHVIIGVVLVD